MPLGKEVDNAINLGGVADPAEFQAEFQEVGVIDYWNFERCAVWQMVYKCMRMGQIIRL
jgi:hypothetical protein